MRIIFLERHAHIWTYSILGYASPRALKNRHLVPNMQGQSSV